MSCAYSWLPESERKYVNVMAFFYSSSKIVSVFDQPQGLLMIEYKNEGRQTNVIHEKKDMMFDGNFVNVFCEDLKLFIQNQKWSIDELEVFYRSDDDAYDEEILNPIIKKIFDTLETSLNSRQFPFLVNNVRVDPATLDQGLSLVNLFNQKELKRFELNFKERLNSVDLGSLVSFQTNNQQYRNCIEVYLDVITEDHWLLLEKLKSMKIIHSLHVLYNSCHPGNLWHRFPDTNVNKNIQLAKIEETAGERTFTPELHHFHERRNHVKEVSSMSSEVACQVFENPIIMERIMKRFELYDIIRMRRVSRGIRNCVDCVKPEPHIKLYSLVFRMFLSPKEHETEHNSETHLTTYMDIELMNDMRKNATYFCIVSDTWHPSDDFDVNILFSKGLDDFEANVRHQNTSLEELEIAYHHVDQSSTWVKFSSEKLAEKIAHLLARRKIPLKVRKLSIDARHSWEVTSILSHIDNDSLKTIVLLNGCWYSSYGTKFEMASISNVEQWMHAEEFISTDVILTTPIQKTNITHFANVDIVVDTMSSSDISFLKTELLNSAALHKFKIAFKKSTIDESLLALIGAPYREIPNVKKIWFFRGQTDPDYYLHIVLETHILEDKTRKIVFSRVKKEETPFFENQ